MIQIQGSDTQQLIIELVQINQLLIISGDTKMLDLLLIFQKQKTNIAFLIQQELQGIIGLS
ncbi:unnamed protein product [Paramecium primaurelia]|uniref:Uncharacterized protein n=1 Tax=Paramecium primaurelia TaxID=5886 RepID=A0A8S1JMR8_PARPR|nr:unnamed protein product [Paramecium primaurelia]